VCAVELSKQCGTGTYNPTTGQLEIPYSVTVTNTGAGPVNSIVASDNDCGFGSGTTLNFGPLAANATDTKNGTCVVPEGFTPPVVNGVSAIADGGDTTVILAANCTTDAASPGVCFSACNFNLSPQIAVTKACSTTLVAQNDVVNVKVLVNGMVTNTSDQPDCVIPDLATEGLCGSDGTTVCTVDGDCTAFPVPIDNVQVVNDNGTPTDTSDDVSLTLLDQCESNSCVIAGTSCSVAADCASPTRLEPGESAFYSDMYLPSILNDPEDASFSDTVTADGVDVFTGQSVMDMATATCKLCPPAN
jgi:hypothetical protein